MTDGPLPSGRRIRDEPGFDDLIRIAAEQADIQPLAIEKDYWVCEALRALAAAYPDNIVFKGGTSLEKLRIIRRFSEDLDILVTGDLGNDNVTKRTLKTMIAVAATATDGDSADPKSGGVTGAFHRRAYLQPQLKNEPVGGIADAKAILVELGQSGGPQPSSPHPVTSLLAAQVQSQGNDLAEWADLVPFDVTILHPGRTLIEKLLRVNNFATRPDAQEDTHGWPRIGRQFYDIWALLRDQRVRDLLADKPQVSGILASITEVSQAFKGDEPVPEGGFAASLAFAAAGDLAPRLQREHDTAIASLYYGNPADAPTYHDVLDLIHNNADLLNPA